MYEGHSDCSQSALFIGEAATSWPPFGPQTQSLFSSETWSVSEGWTREDDSVRLYVAGVDPSACCADRAQLKKYPGCSHPPPALLWSNYSCERVSLGQAHCANSM